MSKPGFFKIRLKLETQVANSYLFVSFLIRIYKHNSCLHFDLFLKYTPVNVNFIYFMENIVITLLLDKHWFLHREMLKKDADRIASCAHTDQSVP